MPDELAALEPEEESGFPKEKESYGFRAYRWEYKFF